MSKEKLKAGDRIKWQYAHSLNGRSSVLIAKFGEYCGKIKHTVRYKSISQMAAVQFDGNKGVSKIPIEELEKI